MDTNYIFIGLTILFIILIYAGVRIVRSSGKTHKSIDKYKFQNRDSGGTVRYKSYEQMNRMKDDESMSGCASIFGVLLILGSAFALLLVLFCWANDIY